jgi:hypothetical protein
MVTQGPFVFMEVLPPGRSEKRPAGPGDEIGSGTPLQVVIRAYAVLGRGGRISKIELLENGRPMPELSATPNLTTTRVEGRLTPKKNAWYIARATQTSIAGTERGWTNPVFAGPRPEAPEPFRVTVRGRINDGAGNAVDGTIEVLGGTEKAAPAASKGGTFEVKAPLTAQIRVTADGYLPETRSVFPDTAARKTIWDMHLDLDREGVAALWTPGTFARMRRDASDAAMVITLTAKRQ